MLFLIGIMVLTSVHPLHLLSMNYRRKIVKQKLKYSLIDRNVPKLLSFKNKVNAVSASMENIQSIYNPKDVREVGDAKLPDLLPLNSSENKEQNDLNLKNTNDEMIMNEDNGLKAQVPKLMSIKEKLFVDEIGSNNFENSEVNKEIEEENSERGQKYTVKRH